MPSYVLTKHADADLEEIVRYTINHWGETQARQYLDKLHGCFQRNARDNEISRTFSERFPRVLVTRCEHHYIFYLHPQNGRPRILAVLHERMDMLTRLEGRLEPKGLDE